MGFSGDEGTVAEFHHKGLNGLHIGLTLLDTTRNVLVITKGKKILQVNNYIAAFLNYILIGFSYFEP